MDKITFQDWLEQTEQQAKLSPEEHVARIKAWLEEGREDGRKGPEGNPGPLENIYLGPTRQGKGCNLSDVRGISLCTMGHTPDSRTI